MKRLIVLLMLAVASLPALAKDDWKGKVVDEKGEPVPYANVAVLSKADSTVVCGVVTQEDGSLVLRLEGDDLLGTAHMDVDSDFGSHTIMQTNLLDMQKVKLSVRYNFNTAQNKYRGTGAGADSKARM